MELISLTTNSPVIRSSSPLFFFFNDTATTEIYTLSLHDALPIFLRGAIGPLVWEVDDLDATKQEDWKSTRLNSSHVSISYAVFCLKKKKIPCRVCCPNEMYTSTRIKAES